MKRDSSFNVHILRLIDVCIIRPVVVVVVVVVVIVIIISRTIFIVLSS